MKVTQDMIQIYHLMTEVEHKGLTRLERYILQETQSSHMCSAWLGEQKNR